MAAIAIATDSNSGITQEEAQQLGIGVLPMPFYIDEQTYYEGSTLSREMFFEKLSQGADIHTSQPSPGEVVDFWENLLKTYDEVIYIPMSSGLSGSCDTAAMLAQDFDGKVHVVDNQRISVPQRQSVYDALDMAEKGMTSSQILEVLMRESRETSIYITVDTLKYLKKGGRVTAAAAAVSSVLNIKPVLTIQGEKLDAYAKAKGWKAARRIMLDALERDLNTRFAGREMYIQAAYTCTQEEAQEWKRQIEERFPGEEVRMDPLPLSIACHTGAGAMAIGCSVKIQI